MGKRRIIIDGEKKDYNRWEKKEHNQLLTKKNKCAILY